MVAIAVIVLVTLSRNLTVKREMGWTDAVTGSTKAQSLWLFGIDTTPVVRQSALAAWLERAEGKTSYDWRHVRGTWMTLSGRSRGFGHGRAPAI